MTAPYLHLPDGGNELDAQPSADRDRPHILIVDDDQEFAESVADILVPEGYAPIVADRPETAVAALQRFAPTVALLDIRLGRFSGVDLLAELRQQQPDLVCVMMTAHAETQTAVAALRSGAYDYVDKLGDPAGLLAVIARSFEKHRLQTENRTAYEALREAKEAAESASRAKSEFLANVSHELRTPLNAIIGFSELMMHEAFGPVGHKKYGGYLADIHDSGLHLLRIINEILDLSKAESGKLEIDEETVVLAGVVDLACRLTAPRAEAAGLTLETEVAAGLPAIRGDTQKLKQVLLNLLSNAVKFTPRGGRVGLVARIAEDGWLTVTIRDSGIGIAAADLQRVLQPFVQVESALSRSHAGTGLGLPLANVMMQLHGGTLRIDSTAGVGTAVTLGFPPDRLLPPDDHGEASPRRKVG